MSSFFIKILALLCMIIDHIGFIIYPEDIIFRLIGRLAFPLFAYQMAVGFSHTRNKQKHILKLLFFAILCQIPTNIINNLYHIELTFNVIFTFVISLLIIFTIENCLSTTSDKKITHKKINSKGLIISTFSTIFLICISIYLNVDYSWYGTLLTILFYFSLNNKLFSILGFVLLLIINYIFSPNLMNLLAFFSLLDCIFIFFFNGKRGYKFSWPFYIIYFIHFFPLLLIKKYIS